MKAQFWHSPTGCSDITKVFLSFLQPILSNANCLCSFSSWFGFYWGATAINESSLCCCNILRLAHTHRPYAGCLWQHLRWMQAGNFVSKTIESTHYKVSGSWLEEERKPREFNHDQEVWMWLTHILSHSRAETRLKISSCSSLVLLECSDAQRPESSLLWRLQYTEQIISHFTGIFWRRIGFWPKAMWTFNASSKSQRTKLLNPTSSLQQHITRREVKTSQQSSLTLDALQQHLILKHQSAKANWEAVDKFLHSPFLCASFCVMLERFQF